MTTLIFGVGIGTFTVITLLIISVVLCCISSRTESSIGPIFSTFSGIVIVVLLLLPRGEDDAHLTQKSEYPLFIWRMCLLILLGISTLGGLGFIIADTLIQVRRPKLLKV